MQFSILFLSLLATFAIASPAAKRGGGGDDCGDGSGSGSGSGSGGDGSGSGSGSGGSGSGSGGSGSGSGGSGSGSGGSGSGSGGDGSGSGGDGSGSGGDGSGSGSGGDGSGSGSSYVPCTSTLYSQASCCSVDVLGVADLNCAIVNPFPTSLADFNATCALTGQEAVCCTLELAETGVLCNAPA